MKCFVSDDAKAKGANKKKMKLVLEAFLGKGSYGSVFRAREKKTENLFALKRCLLFENDGEIVAGTCREFMFHKNATPQFGLCLAHRAWKTDVEAFFLMPLMDATLSDVATHTKLKLSFQDFTHVARALAETLCGLHAQGWMHRDVKPENIYVRADGHVQLGDFSLARFCDASEQTSVATSSTTNVCTLWTRAPELVIADLQGVLSMKTGHEIDTFSLGATLLAFCAGGYVFGKRIASKNEDSAVAYLEGLLGFAGKDALLQAHFPDFDYADAQPFSEFSTRLLQFLPAVWTSEEKHTVASLLSKLLDPLPSRRARIESICSLPFLPPSTQFLSLVARSKTAKPCTPSEVDVPHAAAEVSFVHSAGPLWSLCGHWDVPLPIALQALLSHQQAPVQVSSRALVRLLRLLHQFPFSGSTQDTSRAMQADMVAMLPYVRVSPALWSLGRRVEKKPFVACCVAAFVQKYGRVPEESCLETNEELLRCEESDAYFVAYGKRWKSQQDMLESWRRLSES